MCISFLATHQIKSLLILNLKMINSYLKKKAVVVNVSYFYFILTIIRQYFAVCVIVCLLWTAAVFDILHILCGQFTSVIN